jgi:hypothetical protein
MLYYVRMLGYCFLQQAKYRTMDRPHGELQRNSMFRAIGFVIIVWYFSTLFTSSFRALDRTISATLQTIETAASVSESRMK